MSIINKVSTLFRAGVHDSLENITDANCVRIYRQEIRDAELILQQRRQAMCALIASRKDLEKSLTSVERKIAQRESQVNLLDDTVLTEELLRATAGEIASLERHRDDLKERHVLSCELVAREELTLRTLLSEINQHRRDLKIIEAQLGQNGIARAHMQESTIHGRLQSLRDSRSAISCGLSASHDMEDSLLEVDTRISGNSVDAALKACDKDEESLHIATVMERLQRQRNCGDEREEHRDDD